MNMTKFHFMLTKDVRWWILISMKYTFTEKTLTNPIQHEIYKQIAHEQQDNKIIFLDAEIILRCLKHYHLTYMDPILRDQIINLKHYIKEELDHEEHMSREQLMPVSKYSSDDVMHHMSYEKYELPRVFTDDKVETGIRMRHK